MEPITLHSIDKKLDILIATVGKDFERIHAMDEIQNQQLQEHMDRCDALETQNEQTKKYFDEQLFLLRKPYDFLINLGKVILWAVGAGTSIIILYEAASKVF